MKHIFNTLKYFYFHKTFRKDKPETRAFNTIIGPGILVKGDLLPADNKSMSIQLHGMLEGAVDKTREQTHKERTITLVIEQSGSINLSDVAEIKSAQKCINVDHLIISGFISGVGKISAKTIKITKLGRVYCNEIEYLNTIEIEPGALLNVTKINKLSETENNLMKENVYY